MDFIDQIKQFSKRVENVRQNIFTEEATKTSIIMPFFALLGYDVFNPDEFLPEFTADVGIKKGEKVDYAIMNSGKPVILIEAKWCGEKLEKHDSQLFRYFGTSAAKFAILTNGVIYRFYTDLDEPNKMDEKPFLEINMLDIKDSQIPELKKFQKSSFNLDEILDTASELKYSNEFKNLIANELQSPSDEFTRLFVSSVYSGLKTQVVIEKFKPILKKSLNNYISELMSDKIKTALDTNVNLEIAPEVTQLEREDLPPAIREKTIVTTEIELEAYFLVKNILKEIVPMSDIVYRDTESYMGILYKDNRLYWICRFTLTDNQKVLIIPDENKKPVKYILDDVYDIEKYKNELVAVLKRYMN